MHDVSYLTHSPAARHWQQIGIKTHHGISIPLFSIHSSHSHGIGEFTDLPLLIDWCHSVGFDVIQLLPLNDTELGISPYSAISAFALNPIFLGLESLPHIQDDPFLKEELKSLPKFSFTPHIDYTRVRENKERILRHYYKIIGPQILKSEAFIHFVHTAQYWLKGYAAFKILKRRNHLMSWETWLNEESQPTPQLLDSIAKEDENEYNWFCFLQFLCDQQLADARTYAQRKNVFLMGDIPILICRDSADAWLHQDLFDFNYSAGAPPDMYSELGQNWGFPIYHWQNLAQQNYQWWRERLRWANRYYHIYRIDHIVGFFRIWSIPLGLTGKDGYFIPREEHTWIDHGQKILMMMLDACEMLPIGEDLGVVPPESRVCLSALGICGTRVMRWERKWHEGGQFIYPHDYSVDSMTTVSTHDSETLRQWWRDYPQEAQFYAESKGWSYQPSLSREHHREILWDSHHSKSLFHINLLQEYLGLVPGMSWENPEEERINIPGIVNDQNWCYRIRPSLEELMQQNTLHHFMQELIK